MWSLAATLYAAADFGLAEDEEPAITEDLELLLSSMADDAAADRIELELAVQLALDGFTVAAAAAGGSASGCVAERRLTWNRGRRDGA